MEGVNSKWKVSAMDVKPEDGAIKHCTFANYLEVMRSPTEFVTRLLLCIARPVAKDE